MAADTLTITARQAVIRAGPDSKQRILATVPQGTTLALLETRQGWYKVLLDDGQEGWVAQSAAQVQRGLLRQDAPAPQVSASHLGLYRQSWAVIVGVNRFRDTRIAPLSYATNDAQAVARALGPLGFPASNVTVLRDAQATKGEIERVLSSVVRKATAPEDRLFLFFATHGVTVPLPGGGEEGYLLFHDTDPTDLPYTALSMSALKQIGQRIPARHILVAVDACYGGYSLVRAQAPPVLDRRYLELLAQSRVIQVLTAGRKNQPVLEEQGHGVFTRKLLDGLLGHADSNGDGVLTGTELAAWMHPRVAQASDNKQDMQFGNLDGEGQFFFLLPQAAPSTQSPGTQVAVGVYPQTPGTPKTHRNSIGMEFVLIPAGTFQMGSDDSNAYEDEKPVHTVRLTQPFYLGKHEVTQGQWQAVMGNNPSRFTGDPSRPVETVSWDDVQEFIRRLNSREGGAMYRLPTEAEWEYAARAGTTTRWSFGDDASQLRRYAWYEGNAGGQTHPVGQLQPNP